MVRCFRFPITREASKLERWQRGESGMPHYSISTGVRKTSHIWIPANSPPRPRSYAGVELLHWIFLPAETIGGICVVACICCLPKLLPLASRTCVAGTAVLTQQLRVRRLYELFLGRVGWGDLFKHTHPVEKIEILCWSRRRPILVKITPGVAPNTLHCQLPSPILRSKQHASISWQRR